MVEQQIRTWEVLDPLVLDVLASVPREAFAVSYTHLDVYKRQIIGTPSSCSTWAIR